MRRSVKIVVLMRAMMTSYVTMRSMICRAKIESIRHAALIAVRARSDVTRDAAMVCRHLITLSAATDAADDAAAAAAAALRLRCCATLLHAPMLTLPCAR